MPKRPKCIDVPVTPATLAARAAYRAWRATRTARPAADHPDWGLWDLVPIGTPADTPEARRRARVRAIGDRDRALDEQRRRSTKTVT